MCQRLRHPFPHSTLLQLVLLPLLLLLALSKALLPLLKRALLRALQLWLMLALLLFLALLEQALLLLLVLELAREPPPGIACKVHIPARQHHAEGG
jgi:hypothetical protein